MSRSPTPSKPGTSPTLTIFLGVLFCSSCAGYSTTQRLVGGELLEGPAVAPQAYALYLEATLQEQAGELATARETYLSAAGFQPHSPDLWTRVARLSCLLGLPSANTEFARALREDAWYAPAWIEKSRCEARRGNLDNALRLANLALVAAPEDVAATTALAEVYGMRRDAARALRVWIGYVGTHANDSTAWQQVLTWARRAQDPLWERVASRRVPLQRRRALGEPTLVHSEARVPDALLEAVVADDLPRARAYVTDHRLPQLLVLQLALMVDRPGMSLSQAKLLIGAYPRSGDVRAFSLLAALRADEAQLFREWSSWTEPTTPLSEAGEIALSHVLAEGYGESLDGR